MRSSMITRAMSIVTTFIFIVVACNTVCAEDANEVSGKAEVLTTLEQRMQKTISVDFRSIPIEDVIRAMAAQADVDVLISPQVTGNVTATLTNVPLQEALNNILIAHGFGYVATESMIRVAPLTEIAEGAERLTSRIYRMNYADVKEVETTLKKFISQRGSISSNPSTSNIIVTDTESKIKAIDTFISEIDRITPQILVEVRIYDITSREKLDLGVEWDAGRRTTYDALGEPSGGKTDPFVVGVFEGSTNKTADATLGALRFGLLNESIDLDVQISAEQEDTHAKLLANPRIMVLDNETALFDIVTEHPYVERTISGATITETVKFKEVGVKLEVTPHVTREGMLRLHIVPEFGVLVTRVEVATSNVPVVDTRKVNTIALVKDCQTVVLGGLRKKDVSEQTNKVPLFGDLPLIGSIFRFEGEDTAVTELVVFITPRIIEKPAMSPSEQRAYDVTEFGGPQTTLTRAEQDQQEQ